MYKKLLDNIDAFKKIKKHAQLISLVHLILNQHCLLVNLHTFSKIPPAGTGSVTSEKQLYRFIISTYSSNIIGNKSE